MSEDKTKSAGLFESYVAAIEQDGPLDVTVLVSAVPRHPASARATRAARQIVGGVTRDRERVGRLAALLDDLRDADGRATTPAPKRRNAS